MAFSIKDWRDSPDVGTPINADALEDLEKRLSDYSDALIAAADAMVFKGVIDCSANPNYPAADAGHTYKVSVAGKIGGASGTVVEVGDILLCITDGSASGTQAAVGSRWSVSQANIDGAMTGPASATSGNLPTFNGTSGKILQDSGVAISTDGTLASNSDAKVPTEKAVKTAISLKATLLAAATLVAGQVSSAGAVVLGTGFTSRKTATGSYTVTFNSALASTPVVNATLNTTFGGLTIAVTNKARGSFDIRTFDTTNNLSDIGFEFMAVG